MAKKTPKKTPKQSNQMMPDPKIVLSTWIQDRVKHVTETRWSAELEEWAKCVWNHAHKERPKHGARLTSNHLNEPPIPVVIGFIAEAAANHKSGSAPSSGLDREKLKLIGNTVALLHGDSQDYMTCEECPNIPCSFEPVGSRRKSSRTGVK